MPRTFLRLDRLLGVENEIWHLLVIQRETVLRNTPTEFLQVDQKLLACVTNDKGR